MAAIREARPIVLEPIVQDRDRRARRRRWATSPATCRPSAASSPAPATSATGTVTVRGQVPLSELSGYQSRLNAMTSGQGRYTIELSHYEPVPPSLQQQLISENKVQDEE